MTWVTRIAAGLAGVGLAAGLLTAAPAAAADYGRTGAADGALHRGCHDYRYRYRVTTPTDDWILETFLRDPTGTTIASGTYIVDSDPSAQRATFRFCRYVTRPGRFTIRALVHWYDDDGTDHQAWLRPSHFRLTRPR
jgi:hypothetical protein